MKYCIAADGGGTKTETVLFDETGHILNRYVGPGGNVYDIGEAEAKRRFISCVEHVLAGQSVRVDALYGGIAGVVSGGDIYTEEILPRFAVEKMRIDDDGCNLISGTLGHSDGCGMVCGTGSSLFVRIEGQPLRHFGGKGYLIDTGGSGFELGQAAIRTALRAADGRCPPTVLQELLAGIIGMPITDKVIAPVHKYGRPYIASFAGAVFEGRKLGDWACEEIFETGSDLMADLTYAAEPLFPGDFPVVIGGGIANHFPEYVEAIRRKSSARAKLILQEAPPVYGAAVEAMWDAGISAGEEIKARFLSDHQELLSSEAAMYVRGNNR